ncbi:MAG: M28 family peptidase [Ignavibacteriales bacterium]|nr:M28 family peptidase [Ignavibacteriales bacterium]
MKIAVIRIARPAFFALLIACPAMAQSPSGEDLHRWVRGIEGRDSQGRRDFVKQELNKLPVAFVALPFSRTITSGARQREITGENIVVGLGKGKQTLVVGAHMDAAPESPGANDNGSGVAVVLGLIQAFKDHAWNHRAFFCFFDQEEEGLIGSQAFVESYSDSLNHRAMINLDVAGTGTEIYVGPVGGGDDDFLMPLVRRAAALTGYAFHESEYYPPSDHLSFADRNLENISISIVPKGDVPLLIEAIAGGWSIDPGKTPEVLKVMHTSEDKSVHVSPESLKMSFRFTERLLRLINRTNEK